MAFSLACCTPQPFYVHEASCSSITSLKSETRQENSKTRHAKSIIEA